MEMQVFQNETISSPCYAYKDINRTEQKYHEILSYAIVSSLPRLTVLC